MALEYLLYDVFRDGPELNTHPADRRALRDADNALELPPSEFRKLYRLSPDVANDVVAQLDNNLKGSRITALSSEKQVLSALRFYATGCYQRPVGEQWGISMSHSSVSRCVHRVTDAINSNLFFTKVKFPMTQIERQAAKEIFALAPSSFVGGTIGAIDCTHVSILGPKSHEEAYVNHHGYHSINVQMICDPNLKILNVNARFPGARHDSYIWSSSAIRRVMQRSYENGNHMFLIGDSGYPLEPWLMTPLPNQPEATPKFRYNEALCKARNPIERLFGVLKGTRSKECSFMIPNSLVKLLTRAQCCTTCVWVSKHLSSTVLLQQPQLTIILSIQIHHLPRQKVFKND
ncbi:PREDICTED: putative nuclease HARBI1 [Rhagoletis zephyria]|uniref:putative nuclease HARBI1 n=1 Tax=Rhagoletis zephyria TaxID=28612 RepID=UPI00081192C1|nr:PREDICTED: putative nuclease HARBI1 [Rhagoletis zephyria]